MDSFVASMALGADGVRIPVRSAALIGGVSAGVLTTALLLGQLLAPVLPLWALKTVSFLVLVTLGLIRLFEGLIKTLLREGGGTSADLRFRFLSFQFLLTIYADGALADADHSKTLTPGEAGALSLALSLDSLAAGIGAGLTTTAPLLLWCVLSFSLCMALVLLGERLGRRAVFGRGWVSSVAGVALLVLGILKLV